MIANMCAENEHRQKLRARILHLKTQSSYVKEAILCKQNIAFSCVFTTFLTSNGSKIFYIGHIHAIWVLERSALMSSFKWYQTCGHTMHTDKICVLNEKTDVESRIGFQFSKF